MDNFEHIKICPPMPGACKVCATFHAPDLPHDRDSLYFVIQFRRRYKRFPTWDDAMAHCDTATRKAFCAERGIHERQRLDDDND